MRILYGITKSNWGGAQRYVFDLALAATREGHEATVLCGGEGALTEKLREAGIRVVTLTYLNRDIALFDEAKSFLDILRILRRERPDVFHLNSSKMGGLGALAARLARVKRIVFTAHGWAFNEERHWAERLLIEELAWLTVLLSHRTICVSNRVKKDIEAKPFVRKKLSVIRNGIGEFAMFGRNEARSELLPEVSPESLIIGTLSELHRNKGVDIALRAFNRIGTEAHFAIVGAGEEEKALRQLAKSLGIDERIHFVGFVDDARAYLKAFDIFSLSSRTEGLPYVLLEAGLASLPVVASEVGGIPEVISDGETGLLFHTSYYKAMAEQLERLAKSAAERKRLGQALHTKVKNEFSLPRMVAETFTLYR